MAYKTMLRQLLSKWGMLSAELENAMQKDIIAEQNEDGSVSISGDPESGAGDADFPDAQDVEFSDAASDEPGTDGDAEGSDISLLGVTENQGTGEMKLGDL